MSGAKAEDRARVKALVVDRLEQAGMARKRGVSAAVHEATMGRICERLAYMSDDNLMTLAETLIDNAPDGIWPSELVIREFARGLQEPPAAERRIVTSWLASIEGPKAEAGGHLVELYRWLLKHPRPPMAMDMRGIREQAAENARRCELTRDRIDRETASPEDRGWLEQYLRDRDAARALVDAGRGQKEVKEGDAA
ncbi:hypothetical protein [Cereibacter johrii]|uniref:Uncharacterized protein n=1 Tax=Cereibacter johrii TaxID=445629 RepID=A0ABX5J4C2_9RHOB|nr:hypothetical protein [Cereibacter johrii]ODM42837.1 hypothetical protein A9O63_17205 [Cereibacter johrii]PTM77217.1 hypothetical protein C8J29_106143 [Cereibacter johrii]